MVRDIKHNKNTLKEQQEKEFIKKMEHIERNVPSVFLISFFKSVLIIFNTMTLLFKINNFNECITLLFFGLVSILLSLTEKVSSGNFEITLITKIFCWICIAPPILLTFVVLSAKIDIGTIKLYFKPQILAIIIISLYSFLFCNFGLKKIKGGIL